MCIRIWLICIDCKHNSLQDMECLNPPCQETKEQFNHDYCEACLGTRALDPQPHGPVFYGQVPVPTSGINGLILQGLKKSQEDLILPFAREARVERRLSFAASELSKLKLSPEPFVKAESMEEQSAWDEVKQHSGGFDSLCPERKPHPYKAQLAQLGWIEPLTWEEYRASRPALTPADLIILTIKRTELARSEAPDWPLPLPHESLSNFYQRMHQRYADDKCTPPGTLLAQFNWRQVHDPALRDREASQEARNRAHYYWSPQGCRGPRGWFVKNP